MRTRGGKKTRNGSGGLQSAPKGIKRTLEFKFRLILASETWERQLGKQRHSGVSLFSSTFGYVTYGFFFFYMDGSEKSTQQTQGLGQIHTLHMIR